MPATRPKDPADLSFELNTDYIASITDASFLREDIKVDSQRHKFAICYRPTVEPTIQQKTWYLDGTFKIIKRPFVQLLSIHGFVRSDEDMKQLPLCFIIMSRRQKKDYKKVLQSILNLLPGHIKVESFVVDFESGIWAALRSVFDDPVILGCAFHFGQALWSNIQQDSSTTSKVARDLQEYFDYVEDTWIESGTLPVSTLSVFGRSIRINNDYEGWHNRLNQRAKKGNLPFYLTIDLL